MQNAFRLAAAVVVAAALFHPRAAFGASVYVLSSSTDANPFSTSGTNISFADYDDGSTQVALPFAFTYHGTAYTTVQVCTNGFLDFTSTDSSPSNGDSQLKARVRISPYWDDLNVVTASGDYVWHETQGSSPNRAMVFRWHCRLYGGPTPVDFEARLHEGSNLIDCHYLVTSTNATIGVSAGDGANATFSPYNNSGGSVPAGRVETYTPSVPPDLAPTSFGATSHNAFPGGTVTVTRTVANQGPVNVGSFRIGIYLSDDTVITAADTLLGTQTMPGLVAWATSTATDVYTIPAPTLPGTYYLGIWVDDQSAQIESDETNNTAYDAVPLVVDALPVADNGTLTVYGTTPGSGTLTATDADLLDTLTFSIVANGGKGAATVTNAATGAYSYTGNAGATGTDTFTFKANDGKFDSSTATVTVTFAPVGSVTCSIAPAEAALGGAQWRLTTGPDTAWKGSGVSVGSVPIGAYTVTFKETSGWTKPADANVNVTQGATASASGVYVAALALQSGPTATPNPVLEGQAVAFAVSVTGANVTYQWNFGDGSAVSPEQNPSHVFAAAGTYDVALTAQSGTASLSRHLSVAVELGGRGPTPPGTDSDKDGFPDEIENALKSDPNDPTDVPDEVTPPSRTADLAADKALVRLYFRKPVAHDSARLRCTLPVPAGFIVEGQKLVLNVGGIVRAFVLDGEGNAGDDLEKFSIRVRKEQEDAVGQSAKFTVKFRKGTYAALLTDEGLVDADMSASVEVPVTIIFNGAAYQKTLTLNYVGRKGVRGTARTSKR